MAEMRELPRGAQFVFRGRGDAVAAAGAAFGLALPQTACRATAAASRAALWMGPDEWLLLGDAAEAEDVEQSLSVGLRDHAASLVDVSHRSLMFAVSGPLAAAALNGGCPLDLDERAFPVGMCTRTVFEKAEIVLWRTGSDEFRLGVWRSFAAYVTGAFEQARRGLR
jgi:sarcosine oxidase subunit gamma